MITVYDWTSFSYTIFFLQMSKIMSIDTQDEAHFKKPADTSELTGLEAFAFGYDVQWPISLILNRKYFLKFFLNYFVNSYVIDFRLIFF